MEAYAVFGITDGVLAGRVVPPIPAKLVKYSIEGIRRPFGAAAEQYGTVPPRKQRTSQRKTERRLCSPRGTMSCLIRAWQALERLGRTERAICCHIPDQLHGSATQRRRPRVYSCDAILRQLETANHWLCSFALLHRRFWHPRRRT